MATRDRIRAWLGLDDLATKTLIASAEKAQRDRHGEISERLGRIENLITVNHAHRPPLADVPMYDWDGVQVAKLAEMLANPQKDEN